MSHFAKLDHTLTVVTVLKGRQEDDGKELELCARTGDTYRQTSYNTRGGVYYEPNTNQPAEDQSKAFRKNFAGIGYRYDVDLDAFIPPKPYSSWTLDENTCLWNPPVEHPSDGNVYEWNEMNQSWVDNK